jgi:hypothetical protein
MPPRPITPEEEELAKQIEHKIEGEFYREAELQGKAVCTLSPRYFGPGHLKSEKLRVDTHDQATTNDDAAKALKAEVLSFVLEELLSDLPAAEDTENTMVVRMTPLIFWEAFEPSASKFYNHILFEHGVEVVAVGGSP